MLAVTNKVISNFNRIFYRLFFMHLTELGHNVQFIQHLYYDMTNNIFI